MHSAIDKARRSSQSGRNDAHWPTDYWADALTWRLVNDTAKDEQQLLEKAGKLAQTIAEKSRLTSERILDLVQEAHHGEDFDKGLKKKPSILVKCLTVPMQKRVLPHF